MARVVAPLAKPRRIAAYVRQSVTRAQEEFGSTKAQEDVIRAWAKMMGITDVTIFRDDNRSGASLDRPAFQRMMRGVRAGEFDVIVVVRLDRLSRSLRDFVALMDELQRLNVAFVSTSQSFDTSSPLGRMTMSLLAVFSQFERETTSDRTREKISAARRRGIFTGGRVPLGYELLAGKLVLNVADAVVVREAFAAYLQTRSALQTARTLNDRGRRTKAGRLWDKARVLTLLKSPVPAGILAAGDELVEGQHEACVTREVWDRAQEILNGRAGQDHAGPRTSCSLSGRVRCGCCGGAYVVASTKKGDRTYVYLRCTTRDARGADACPGRPLPAGPVETFVIARIKEAVAAANLDGDILTAVRARVADERQVLGAERRRLPEEIARLAQEQARIVDRLLETTGPAGVAIEGRLDDVAQKRAEAEARLNEVERRLTALEGAEANAAHVLATIDSLDAVMGHMTTNNRRLLVQTLVEEIVVDQPAGRIRVTLKGLLEAA